MPINRRHIMLLFFVVLGLYFLATLPIANDRWSVANAQGTITTPTRTGTPFDPNAHDVPESDSLLLVAGGFAGLATWLAWQHSKIKKRGD